MGAEGASGAELDAYIEGVKKFPKNFLWHGIPGIWGGGLT